MDKTLVWFGQFVHSEHIAKSGEPQWQDCDLWPCHHLRNAVLKGIPAPYVEMDGSGTY